VLNKFRGDASLLAPAPQQLEQLTGIPTIATIPMLRHHGLPEEDGVFDDRSTAGGAVNLTVAVVAYPRISNLDEFQPLKNVPGVRLVWARTPAELVGADWVILPGSKSTVADLAWLRAQGLDAAVCQHAARGGAVLGICGGLQMLGEAIVDTEGVEWHPAAPGTRAQRPTAQALRDGNAPGLGLLPLVTSFGPDKTLAHTSACFGDMGGPWAALSGVAVRGYEIHQGQTAQHPAMAAAGDVAVAVLHNSHGGVTGWCNRVLSVTPADSTRADPSAGVLTTLSHGGPVLGIYLHGLFEDPNAMQALFGGRARVLDQVFEGLGDVVSADFPEKVLRDWVHPTDPVRAEANRRQCGPI
jgi:adenosylcobyric acid synthase